MTFEKVTDSGSSSKISLVFPRCFGNDYLTNSGIVCTCNCLLKSMSGQMISRAQSCATVKTMTGVSVRLRLVNITQLWGFRKG